MPDVTAALTRFRVVAYVVGVGLILLVVVGVPLKYLASEEAVVAAVGPLHGILFVGYLLATADLARRCRWTLARTGFVMLAGTVPFMSFVVERRITAEVRSAARASRAPRPAADAGGPRV